MGYTHYFTLKKTVSNQQWDNFKKDANIIIEHIQNHMGIVLKTNDNNGIILNNERLNLNGDDTCDLDYETFLLDKYYPHFNFCKTGQRPYDLAVCSLLLLAHEHMPYHYDISSDGGFEDWKDAMKLNAEILGHGYKLPEGIDSSEDLRKFEEELSKTTQKTISPQKKEFSFDFKKYF